MLNQSFIWYQKIVIVNHLIIPEFNIYKCVYMYKYLYHYRKDAL